ncbi:MAG: hypothetical protein JKY80_04060 [Mariprofundaceae bacterium]|nr:hypothetical protein [Mariprofundaceae bacterium]
MHVFCAIALSIFGLSGVAQAASLGKADVASHLGEPFYAEVPLGLDEDEAISNIFVELASPADYQILEVFRDSAVGAIRVDVKNDSRGSRVELTTTSAVEAPFLNLVLKVRYGRATHFKKFSIFLDLPRAAKPNVTKAKVLPVRRMEDISGNPMLEAAPVVEKVAEESPKSSFKPYDGWARTAQYGPMVYGDTISTVAQRLRVDTRYSRQQVMMALFEKNKSKFDKENINLINAGTYLDVPSAQEVEHISHSQALSLLKAHNAKWKELTKQTKYAKVQEAQKNRYGKHVRMGESASGVASKPIAKGDANTVLSKPELATDVAANNSKKVVSSGEETQNNGASTELRQENDSLQQRLKDMEAKMEKLAAQATSVEGLAASNARIKKLELQLARQVGELEKARKQASMQQSDSDMGLLTWILIGIVALLSMIAGYLAYALRGQRSHPVDQENMMDPALEENSVEESGVEEIDVEEVDVAEVTEADVTPVDFEASVMASSDTIEGALTEGIPELTDEDTSEMQAFDEPTEEPDPNVDYLTEADVYMRYGMEDEAEKQVGMALRLRSDNKDAHVKLTQIRHARGNQSGVDEAAATARSVLEGEALATFTTAFNALEAGTSDEEEVSLDDTMPPTTLEELSSNSADEDALQADSSLDIDDFDLPDFASEEPSTESVDSVIEAESSLDLGDIDVDIKAEDSDALLGEMADENTADVASLSDTPDDEPNLTEREQPEAVIEEAVDLGDSLDNLNLSDIEMPDLDAQSKEEPSVASALEEITMDSTVVMDWSKDTSVITAGEDIGGESGSNLASSDEAASSPVDEPIVDLAEPSLEEGLDIDLSALEDMGEEDMPSLTAEESESSLGDAKEKPADNVEDELSSISFNLDDLDVDLDATPDDGDIDDFTSTIQSTLIDLGVMESELDVSLEPVDEADSKSEDKGKDDFDADLELDNLLSDLDTLSGDDKDKK